MINWRERYKESQMIQSTDTNVSTERIRRLVTIYKKDLIEEDLHPYAQRLSNIVRCCQSCTPKSYTNYKWLDTFICSNKDLFDFSRSGRSVSPLFYYWNKTLSELHDQRGQISDFQSDEKEKILNVHCLSTFARNNENTFIKKTFIPSLIHRWIRRFQMYYTYRKARQLSETLNVHTQILKTIRFFFQSHIPTLFICFAKDDQHFRELFWMFRHLITVSNWPWETKIFTNRSFDSESVLEKIMMNYLGLVDLSSLNLHRLDLFRFLYRCLKTIEQNGPMIFLFHSSTMFKPEASDNYLISFLIDLIQFDLSIPDLLIIPTSFNRSTLLFSQPFLFKELIESFLKKFNIEQSCLQMIDRFEPTRVHRLIETLFLHLAYDVEQLKLPTMTKQHLLAAIELCQSSKDQINTNVQLFDVFERLHQRCSFIKTDDQLWNTINMNDINEYFSTTKQNKFEKVSELRQKYFLEILAALSILSKIQPGETISRILESDLFNQLEFLLVTFVTKESFVVRSCQNLQQIIQHIVQLCQKQGYLVTDDGFQKSMTFRDTILSDHEWSEEDDDEIDLIDEDFDHDEMDLTDPLDQPVIPLPIQPAFRINNRENFDQMKFFGQSFAAHLEAIVVILDHHISKKLSSFTLENFNNNDQNYHFRETSSLITNVCLDNIHRAHAYRTSLQERSLFSDLSIYDAQCVIDICPLSPDDLCSLRDDFAHLLNCCF